jgi:hypothetical protein
MRPGEWPDKVFMENGPGYYTEIWRNYGIREKEMPNYSHIWAKCQIDACCWRGINSGQDSCGRIFERRSDDEAQICRMFSANLLCLVFASSPYKG